MAAKRLYDPPNVQLMGLLLEARREGLEFWQAWDRAVRPGRALVMSNTKLAPQGALKWPTDRADREAWRAAIIGSREGWRRAYDREPPLAREVAIMELGDVIGVLERAAKDRADRGIAAGSAVLSAA